MVTELASQTQNNQPLATSTMKNSSHNLLDIGLHHTWHKKFREIPSTKSEHNKRVKKRERKYAEKEREAKRRNKRCAQLWGDGFANGMDIMWRADDIETDPEDDTWWDDQETVDTVPKTVDTVPTRQTLPELNIVLKPLPRPVRPTPPQKTVAPGTQPGAQPRFLKPMTSKNEILETVKKFIDADGAVFDSPHGIGAMKAPEFMRMLSEEQNPLAQTVRELFAVGLELGDGVAERLGYVLPLNKDDIATEYRKKSEQLARMQQLGWNMRL